MDQKSIAMVCVGGALLLTGFLLSASEMVAQWGLSHGRARIWVELLGRERAMKPTRYFFGPLTIVLGILALVIGFRGE